MSELTEGNKSKGTLSNRQVFAAKYVASGMTQADAARKIGVHPSTVTGWKKEKAFADFLAEMEEEYQDRVDAARSLIIEGVPQAALKMLGLLDSEDEGIQFRASGDIMDRAGVSKVAKVEAEVTGEVTFLDLIVKAREDSESE